MDYILLSTLIGVIMLCLLISYDIACQHSKNLVKRMLLYDERLHINLEHVKRRHAVPKNHIAMHGAGHSKWSLNHLPHVGLSCCEGIESSWGHMNPVSMSTKQMAPSLRREVLDDHWGAWNWRKVVNMGAYLLCFISHLAD